MPLSPSDVSAIQEMAEAAGLPEPVDVRLERTLDIARRALGLDALSAVALDGARSLVRSWHSASVGCRSSAHQAVGEAVRAFGNGAATKPRRGCLVLPIASSDGRLAALVPLGGDGIDEESAVLKAAAGFAALLIENSALAELAADANRSSNRHMEELAAVYEISTATESSDLRPLLDMIVAKAAAVMGAQACSLMLRDPRDGALKIEASYGLTEDVVSGARLNVGEGIAGRVAESGEPVLISDVSVDPRFAGGVRPRPGVSGSMCVPLRDENGSVNGVLSIRRHLPNPPFGEADLKLFCVFARHAAMAISNTRLHTGLAQKIHEMSTISDVLRAINSTLDLDDVLNEIAQSITQVVGFDRCCVYLLDSRTDEFVAGARRGYESSNRIRERVRFDEGVIGLAAKERIPIFSQGSPIEYEGAQCTGEFLVAPIVVRDSCIGVVVVDNCLLNRRIESQHVELLATFVSQAGIAVENARLYEAMEQKYAELNVLYEQSKSISAASGLHSAAETLVQISSKAVPCDGAGVLLLDAKRGQLALEAAWGGTLKRSARIEEIAREERCVDFVRSLGNPVLVPRNSPRRGAGLNADLFSALAPSRADLMLVPLVAEDTTIGLLALYRSKNGEFQGAELKLASIVASHASTVLKSAMAYELKMRQRVLELTALYEFSKRLSSAANLEEALDSILAIVAELVDYDESFIYAVDPERGVATMKAARLRGSGEPVPTEEPLDSGSVTSWAITKRKALVSPDIGRDSRFRDRGSGGEPVRSLMSIPLIVQEDVVGVLNVCSYSPNQYSEEDVRVLSIIASQGAAIYRELEALSALTSYTDNILSSIAAGVATLDSDGTVWSWNSAAERIIGIKAERIYGLHFEEVLSKLRLTAQDKSRIREVISGVLESGETYQGYKLAFHPLGRDEIYVNMSVSQLLNSAGEQLGLVIIFEDVTKEIRMENEFRRMGELAAVGQLAASIAHELRNPLSSIRGAAQFLQKEYEDLSGIVEFLGIIIEEVNGLNKLTTEFLDFARPMQLELKPCSVNGVVDRTLQLMSVHITDSNVVVREDLDRSTPEIQADEKQLEQVLKNIILNALQSMPEGGVLTVSTGPTASGGAYVEVTDTGVGIPDEKLDRIFVPFFTTKTKGTGLGLSVVQKIVDNHGGRIDVASKADVGTTFRITLPQTGASAIMAVEIDQASERRM